MPVKVGLALGAPYVLTHAVVATLVLSSTADGVVVVTAPLNDAVPSIFKLRLAAPVADGLAAKNFTGPVCVVNVRPSPFLTYILLTVPPWFM